MVGELAYYFFKLSNAPWLARRGMDTAGIDWYIIHGIEDNNEAQYSTWTVGLLSSAKCSLCLCNLLAATSQFSIIIGQEI